MRSLVIATLCLAFCGPCLAQSSDTDPATKDDVILYLRTMRSHDLVEKLMEVQSQTMQKLLRDQLLQDKGKIPPDFDAHMKKEMADLVRGMPIDDILQAMIPAYQNHFTRSDIAAMNAFYSSPVGQKVLEELPAVNQEGMKAALPIMSKYLTEWKQHMAQDMKDLEESAPKAAPASATPAPNGPSAAAQP
jgi:hypothetical protein